MLRGVTETGSIFIGLVPGPLLDRLVSGERVLLPGHVDANGVEHIALYLDFSRGPASVARLLAGERVCIQAVHDETGRCVHPHVCIFMRADNERLLDAANALFPGGLLPGARVEHVTTEDAIADELDRLGRPKALTRKDTARERPLTPEEEALASLERRLHRGL